MPRSGYVQNKTKQKQNTHIALRMNTAGLNSGISIC